MAKTSSPLSNTMYARSRLSVGTVVQALTGYDNIGCYDSNNRDVANNIFGSCQSG